MTCFDSHTKFALAGTTSTIRRPQQGRVSATACRTPLALQGPQGPRAILAIGIQRWCPVRNPHLGIRALELGAGLGLVSLAAARLGMRVTASPGHPGPRWVHLIYQPAHPAVPWPGPLRRLPRFTAGVFVEPTSCTSRPQQRFPDSPLQIYPCTPSWHPGRLGRRAWSR